MDRKIYIVYSLREGSFHRAEIETVREGQGLHIPDRAINNVVLLSRKKAEATRDEWNEIYNKMKKKAEI